MEVRVGMLATGKSIIYTIDEKSGSMADGMFVEPVRDEKTQSVKLQFAPVATFSQVEDKIQIDTNKFLVDYVPDSDVQRIYNLFLEEFHDNRREAEEHREQMRPKNTAKVISITKNGIPGGSRD